MALLIDIGQPEWMRNEDLRDHLSAALPGIPILCGKPADTREDVLMLAVSRLDETLLPLLPNLKLVQKLGAGVETIVGSAALPDTVRVARLKPDAPAQEIAHYCLAHVLHHHRNLARHAADQQRANWRPVGPAPLGTVTVGVLGLGHIGGRTARLFADLGYRTLGWSRTKKDLDGIECRHGRTGLQDLLGESDYVAAVLPSTPATRDLLDSETLGWMKPDSVLINVGRGDLVVDDDLLSALAHKRPAHAVLDVFRREPLPPGHPFWDHPNVTVTPHVSGWNIDDGVADVAENYRRLIAAEPLLHEVDRGNGY